MSEGDGAPDDDLSISDDTDLFRRVHPAHYKLENGRFVVRDGAFKNFPQPERKRMSVVLGDTLAGLGRSPESVLRAGDDEYGVVAIKARHVRAAEQRIERSEQDDEPAHGDVYGDKTAGRRKRLAAAAEWVVYPTTH